MSAPAFPPGYVVALNNAATREFIPAEEAAAGIPKSVVELAGTALTYYVNDTGEFTVAIDIEDVPDALLTPDSGDHPVARIAVKLNGTRQKLLDDENHKPGNDFETAVSELTFEQLVGIVQLAALTEESYHPDSLNDGDEDHAYGVAIDEHPDPDAVRTLLMRLAGSLPR